VTNVLKGSLGNLSYTVDERCLKNSSLESWNEGLLGRTGHRREHNVKMDLKEMD